MIDAFHLPGVSHLPTTTWAYGRGAGEVELRLPQLTPKLLERQVRALLRARERHLAERPVREIVAVVDAVARRLLDPADPLRRSAEEALPPVTGFSPAMIRLVLDRMAADWRAPRLRELLRAEFGDPRVLDEFRPRGNTSGMMRAFGPGLVIHIFSGNVPGIAVTSLIRALLVKSASLGKTAVGEPLLPALFARAVAEEDSDLGDCLAVTYWPGGAEELERVALEKADAVIAYGSDEATAAIRARTPKHARFIPYGLKLSFAVIGRELLGREAAVQAAEKAALAAATFDQHGCVSPHLFYVEEGGDVAPQEWTALLAAAMRQLESELPRGSVAPGEAATIRQLRGEAEFAQIMKSGTELHQSDEGTAWTVIYDPDPTFQASCLNRLVRVKPIGALSAVPQHVNGVEGRLQSVGVAAAPERRMTLAAALGRIGASRIVPLEEMAWPPPTWHHDGSSPLCELVHWCDVEQ